MRRRLLILAVWLLIATSRLHLSSHGPFGGSDPNRGGSSRRRSNRSPTPIPQTPTPGPLTLVYWEEESDDGDVLLDELAAEFMRANPDIIVQRAHYRYEELSLLFRTAALSGAGPDLVRAPGNSPNRSLRWASSSPPLRSLMRRR